MRLFYIISFCLVLINQLSAQTKDYIPKKSTFLPSQFPKAPSYDSKSAWAAHPNAKDKADELPTNKLTENQKNALADVFFIHPTTYTEKPQGLHYWNADVNDAYINKKTDESTILYQASIFNESCKVYAPRYRQAHIFAFFTDKEKEAVAAFDTAYADIRKAFNYYLNNLNQGRPFIIASHSQGTVHAVRLIREELQKRTEFKQLIAAYLVGMPVKADTLKGLPPCTSSGQTGCFTSWCTYANGYYPSTYEDGAKYALCTNPLTWKIEDQNYAESKLNKGGVLKGFSKVDPELCDAKVHKGLLWINTPNVPGAKFAKIDNYHIGDYNLFYMNVRENVAERVKNFIKNKE